MTLVLVTLNKSSYSSAACWETSWQKKICFVRRDLGWQVTKQKNSFCDSFIANKISKYVRRPTDETWKIKDVNCKKYMYIVYSPWDVLNNDLHQNTTIAYFFSLTRHWLSLDTCCKFSGNRFLSFFLSIFSGNVILETCWLTCG